MNVLVVKTSSLGDVIHTLPALTDAAGAIPGIRFDWVVEEAFSEIPSWHPAVRRVIPIALRRWRRQPARAVLGGEIKAFVSQLRRFRYDLVIDAQGLLIKSALVAALARGRSCGFDRKSAREPLVAWSYHECYRVDRDQHAIERVRRLFAQALGYPYRESEPGYGLRPLLPPRDSAVRYLVFLHGTTWETKHWPEVYWRELTELAVAAGYEVHLPWGNEQERARAQRIAEGSEGVRVLGRMSLSKLAAELAAAAGVVGVDTGLCHLAAALEVPAVTLYGATRADLTGTRGPAQRRLSADFPCAPCLERRCTYTGATPVVPACFASLQPALVWAELAGLLEETPR